MSRAAIVALEHALAEARSARVAASQSLVDAQHIVAAAREAAESVEETARVKAVRADEILTSVTTINASVEPNASPDEKENEFITTIPVRRTAAVIDFTASVSLLFDGALPHAPLSKINVLFTVQRNQPMEGSEGPDENDFLGLYRSDTVVTPTAAQEDHLNITYVDGAMNGTLQLQLPSMVGLYSVWYVHASGTVAARSDPFLIAALTHKNEDDDLKHTQSVPPVSLPTIPTSTAHDLTPSPSLYDTLSRRSHFIPPYMLEVLPRISVVQLIVPLPTCLRSRTKNAPATHSLVNTALLLPFGWTPGIEIEGDRPGSTDAAIVFAMELPRIGSVSAYDASPSDLAAIGAGSNISSLARDLFLLRLPLTNRIESAKVVLSVFSDHVSVRLPFYFSGSVLPERPTSLVSLSEMSSLRSHGRELACRLCGASILASAAATPTPLGLRVLLLPSEYWLEWSEYWLCHQGQENIYLPRDDDGELCALRGAALVGETHMQVHVSDLRSEACRLLPSSVDGDSNAGDVNWWAEGVISQSIDSNVVTALSFDVECARCASVLGTLSTSVRVASAIRLANALRSTENTASCGANLFPLKTTDSLLPVLFEVDDFPSRLTANRHPSFRLHKDRLSLRADLIPLNAPSINRPILCDAFELYATSSRIASTMLAAALAHGQFWFVWAQSSGASTSEARVLVGLLNWNTAIRGAGRPTASSSSSSLPISALPWEKGGDLASAKVRFRVLQSPLSEDDRAATLAWGNTSTLAAQVIRLSVDEVDEAIAVLGTSMALLPRSSRLLDGCSVGFLPFLSGPLRLARRS
jgi:hypothetical protein